MLSTRTIHCGATAAAPPLTGCFRKAVRRAQVPLNAFNSAPPPMGPSGGELGDGKNTWIYQLTVYLHLNNGS